MVAIKDCGSAFFPLYYVGRKGRGGEAALQEAFDNTHRTNISAWVAPSAGSKQLNRRAATG